MSEPLVIRQEPDAPLPVAQSLEQEVSIRLGGTRDGQEGIDAFLDKRDPDFKGQ
jgi:1,4-dihydroxy-2-naphthoyl-CoA synthase